MSGRTWTVEARLSVRKLFFFGPVDPTTIKEVQRPERVDERIRQLAFYELVRVDPVPGKPVESKRELPFQQLVRDVPDDEEAA